MINWISFTVFAITTVLQSYTTNNADAFIIVTTTPTILSKHQQRSSSLLIPLFSSTDDNNTNNQSIYSVVDRLQLEDNFERWRFLQNLMDEETDPEDVNQILYALLHSYMIRDTDNQQDSTAPEKTIEFIHTVEGVLQQAEELCDDHDSDHDHGKKLPVLEENHAGGKIIAMIEDVLPDPVEKEDAFKGAWDTIMELHGREAVKQGQASGRPEWNNVCLCARVMIYFDFLHNDWIV